MGEHRPMVLEYRLLRKIVRPKRDEVTGSGENYIMRSLMICTPHQLLLGDKIEKNEMGWACGTFGEDEGLLGRPEGKKPLERYRRR